MREETVMGSKILVIDDDPIILKFMTSFLTREGFEVYSMDDGTELTKEFIKIKPDLVLMDVLMPGKDGFELCKELRKFSDVPIIIISAKNETIDRVLGLTLGSDDYLTKPFDSTELLLRIKSILRRSKEQNSLSCNREIIRAKGIMIDVNGRIVKVNSNEVKLTPKEFSLLYLLAKNPNQVFTREQLLNKIWLTSFAEDTGMVTTLVKRLREKIEKNPSRPEIIKTIRGIGYKYGGECH